MRKNSYIEPVTEPTLSQRPFRYLGTRQQSHFLMKLNSLACGLILSTFSIRGKVSKAASRFVCRLTSIECLGTMYLVEPICDDVNATLPLELHVINFESHYYSTIQGRRVCSFSKLVSILILLQERRNSST